MDWIETHAPESERTLLLVAGAAFLGAVSFLGETWDEAPYLRADFVASVFWFWRSMLAVLAATALRLLGQRRLDRWAVRVPYFFLLVLSLVFLARGGIGMAATLEEHLAR